MTKAGLSQSSLNDDMDALTNDGSITQHHPRPVGEGSVSAIADGIDFTYTDEEEDAVKDASGDVTKASLNEYFRNHYKDEYGVEVEITKGDGPQDLVNVGNFPRGNVIGLPHDVHRFLKAYESGDLPL